MVIRITWGKLRAGAWAEFERTYRDHVLTKGKHLKGLRGLPGTPVTNGFVEGLDGTILQEHWAAAGRAAPARGCAASAR